MKTAHEILRDLPLHCISHLTSKHIAKTFGLTEATTSYIMSDKYRNESKYLTPEQKDMFKSVVDEMDINVKEENKWMGSKEREYIKSVSL